MQMNNQASTLAESDSWNKTEQGITLVSSSLQTTKIVFTEDLVQKNREGKYDLCCEQIEIIYGRTVTPFVFWSFADWFQESVRIVVVFWPCQDFGRDYRVGHFGRQKRKEDVEGGDPLIKL